MAELEQLLMTLREYRRLAAPMPDADAMDLPPAA